MAVWLGHASVLGIYVALVDWLTPLFFHICTVPTNKYVEGGPGVSEPGKMYKIPVDLFINPDISIFGAV